MMIQATAKPTELPETVAKSTRQSRFASNPDSVFDYRLTDAAAEFVDSVVGRFPPLEEGFDVGVGINTGFIREDLVADYRIDERYHPMVPGSGIARYGAVETQGWILYDKEYVRSRGELGRSLPPERYFDSEKILVVRTRNLSLPRRVIATLDSSGAYNLNRLSNIVAKGDADLMGLLGILNSCLVNFLFSTRFWDYEIKPVYLRAIPVADTHDRALSAAVERILALNVEFANAKTTHETEILKRRVLTVDKQIDQLVYELYGLTDKEIRIVEEATK